MPGRPWSPCVAPRLAPCAAQDVRRCCKCDPFHMEMGIDAGMITLLGSECRRSRGWQLHTHGRSLDSTARSVSASKGRWFGCTTRAQPTRTRATESITPTSMPSLLVGRYEIRWCDEAITRRARLAHITVGLPGARCTLAMLDHANSTLIMYNNISCFSRQRPRFTRHLVPFAYARECMMERCAR